MQYSPKLKKALAQIDEIMKEHDIGGTVILHTPGFSEYKSYISPSYSCAYFDYSIPNAIGIRFKAKAAELPGGAAERDQKIADTDNLFLHLISGHASHFKMFDDSYTQFTKTTGGHDHTGGRHTGPQEQGN